MKKARRRLPLRLRLALALIAAAGAWAAVNFVVQVVRKPAELLDLFPGKDLPATWKAYEPAFRAHATDTITPAFLAALVQVESAGNPLATPRWRWRASWNPFDWYGPSSTAAGILQLTDAAFEDCRRFCVRAGRAAERGQWYDPRGCWFNDLYSRLVPSDAIEMSAACLDRKVAAIAGRLKLPLTLSQKQDLAAVVHLCGARAGEAYAREGLGRPRRRDCSWQDAAGYLRKMRRYRRTFSELARGV